MRRIFRGAALLLLGALVAALPAADDTPAPKTKPKEKFEYGPAIDGKLTKLEGSTKNFTVQMTFAVPDPQKTAENQNYYNQQLAQISGEKNPARRQQRFLQLQADMQRRTATAVKKVTKDADFQADDNVKVRILQLPTEYDDKGNPKKQRTKTELAALKGPDKTLPGYTADYDQLHTGQYVKVFLPKPKQGKSKTPDKTAAKTEDPDLGVERPRAVMILIVADPPAQ